jgi:hypothetical protein
MWGVQTLDYARPRRRRIPPWVIAIAVVAISIAAYLRWRETDTPATKVTDTVHSYNVFVTVERGTSSATMSTTDPAQQNENLHNGKP